VVNPVWIAAFGTLISATTLVLTLYFRRRDSQSHVKIDYYVGNDPPHDWRTAANMPRMTPAYPVAMFWVLNEGARVESLQAAYIAVPGANDLHPFSAGNPPRPSPLQPGFPCVFGQTLEGFSRELVNRGCTGTARVDLVIQLGRGDLHKKRIEIPDVEARAEGREPG
jgi:hypothetical protein